MNPIAVELNEIIKNGNPHVLEMLSRVGKNLYFPKGILSQSAEAREKAYDRFNATIGIATEELHTMHLDTVMSFIQNLRASDTLTYAPSFGIPRLRNEWKRSLYEKNPSLKDAELSLPIVTNGITHGISTFSDMFIDPEDAVIFPDKMWGNNNLILCVRNDARIIQYPLFSGDGGFNLDGFGETIRKNAKYRTKIIVFLNFPNNPTGYTVTEAEGEKIADILVKTAQNGTNVIAVTDDAYFGLAYEDAPMKESVFAKLCDKHPRLLAVKLDGATKEMFVWGFRVGFITYNTVIEGEKSRFYEALEKKTAGDIRGTLSNASHIGQSIVLKTLQSSSFKKERDEKFETLKKRALRVKEVSTDPGYADAWSVYPFNSGYFMCLQLKTVNAESLRVHLLEKYKVGLISIGNHDLRVAFSCLDFEDIDELFEVIDKGVKDLEAGTES